MAATKKTGEPMVHASSGNVFEDLGVSGPERAHARAELAAAIVAIVDARGLSQSEVADLLGIDQPGVSNLVRGRLERFSSERLMRFLVALGQDVEIRIAPKAQDQAAATLRVTQKTS